MRKRILIATGAVTAVMGLSASSAMADTPQLASAPFVCPVLTVSQQAVDNSGKFGSIGGDGTYTFAPGNAGSAGTFNGNVPNYATNADGAGSPTADGHSSPGESNYTAIWSGN
jgi:ABC-type phosphate transport system substrate-binding protein